MEKIKHRRGDSATWTFLILDVDPTTGVETALPLDDYLIRLTCKTNPDDADSAALIRLSSSAGGITKLATTGYFIASLTPDLTRDMSIGQKMYFDVQLTDSGGSVATPVYGLITIVADVTYNAADIGTDV